MVESTPEPRFMKVVTRASKVTGASVAFVKASR